MATTGCDTATVITTSNEKILLDNDIKFVGRYLASLTTKEVQVITNAGLKLFSIWEKGSPTNIRYFTRAKGLSDATSAISATNAIGQTSRSTIYFAVDYDASSQDISGGITQYLEAIEEVF